MASILSRLFGSNRTQQREATGSSTPAGSGQSSASQPRLGRSYLDLPATTPLQISTVYACVNVISNSISTLPLAYLKRQGSGVYLPDSSRLNYLLGLQPNEDYNISDFISQAVRHILLRGNAYVVPVWSPVEMGEMSALILCNPDSVAYDSLNRIYHISDPENGVLGDYAENEVIHLKGFSLDGKRGLSVLSFARQSMDIASTGDSETLNRFLNGGNVRGIVSNDTSVRGFGEYADVELKKTAESIDERFRGGERIINLPGQAKFDQLSMSSVDLEFLQSRKFGVREICRFFCVPPTYIFDDTSNNYKSAEMASVAFMSQCLSPILVRIEQEFTRKLVAPHRYGKYKVEFDRRAFYATDLLTKADYQTKTIASGVYTINDWRQYENKMAVDGGDKILVSANLKSLDELLTTPAAAPSPAPAEGTNNEDHEEQ